VRRVRESGATQCSKNGMLALAARAFERGERRAQVIEEQAASQASVRRDEQVCRSIGAMVSSRVQSSKGGGLDIGGAITDGSSATSQPVSAACVSAAGCHQLIACLQALARTEAESRSGSVLDWIRRSTGSLKASSNRPSTPGSPKRLHIGGRRQSRPTTPSFSRGKIEDVRGGSDRALQDAPLSGASGVGHWMQSVLRSQFNAQAG
jgi:hypothetical protein